MDCYKAKFLFAILFVWHFCVSHGIKPRYTCATIDGKISSCPNDSRPSVFEPHLVAFVKYANRINKTGWAELEIVTNGELKDQVQAYYAGYLEGYVTASLIKSYRHNTQDGGECHVFKQAIETNLKSTVARVKEHENDPYWREVGNSLYQVAGMDDGFALAQGKHSSNKPHLNIDPCESMLMNLITEQYGLLNIINNGANSTPVNHCSALVKVINGGQDVVVSHNTWANYNMMLRLLKKYSLNYSTSASKSVVMSSFPGVIYSLDDFYITSSRLVIQETTNSNFNTQLFRVEHLDQLVFEFIRNTVANRLAATGAEWTKIYAKHLSGTYTNQFMVVDFKKFSPNNIQDGFLYIVEQLPGINIAEDQTEHLRKQSYWASYNVPFYKTIYKQSKMEEMFEKYGDFYSYEKTGRAKIFRRDHVKVTNMTTLFHLMRYNDFEHDPFAKCNCTPAYTAAYAIAARGDLNSPSGVYPISDLGFSPVGALDAKMTNSRLSENLEMIAVGGPTNENQPTFSWATTKLKERHLDQPIEWNFKPVITRWNITDGVFPNFVFDL